MQVTITINGQEVTRMWSRACCSCISSATPPA